MLSLLSTTLYIIFNSPWRQNHLLSLVVANSVFLLVYSLAQSVWPMSRSLLSKVRASRLFHINGDLLGASVQTEVRWNFPSRFVRPLLCREYTLRYCRTRLRSST